MTDVAVIILVGQERLHIGRCIERIDPLKPRQVFLVTSQPDDGGEAIACETACALGWTIGETNVDTSVPNLQFHFNKWPGLYAKQFNWALDNMRIKASWVLRLDADE